MKYIILFETWQWLNRDEDSDEERDYRATVGELLSWVSGPDWADGPENLIDFLMVDGDWPDSDELIGYHEMLKKRADTEIEIYSQEMDGQVCSDWGLDGVDFSLISNDWPFSLSDELTDEEKKVYSRLVAELDPELIGLGANLADIIDFIVEMRHKGESHLKLSSTGFKNWFSLQRSGAN